MLACTYVRACVGRLVHGDIHTGQFLLMEADGVSAYVIAEYVWAVKEGFARLETEARRVADGLEIECRDCPSADYGDEV